MCAAVPPYGGKARMGRRQGQSTATNSSSSPSADAVIARNMKRIRMENDGGPFDNGEHGEQPPHVQPERWHDLSAMEWQIWCGNAWAILGTAPPEIIAAAAAMADEDAPPATSAAAAADMADDDAA